MIPIPFNGWNKILNPAAGTENKIAPLQAHNADGVTTSCWTFSPEELAEVNATGRIFVQVHAGESSPPIGLTPFQPVAPLHTFAPEMGADVYQQCLAEGCCPWCHGETGFKRIDGKMVTTTNSWKQDKPIPFSISTFGPFILCLECGTAIDLHSEPDPLVEARVVSLTQEATGVPKKETESMDEYNDRLNRILGGPAMQRVFKEVQSKLHGEQG